MSSNALNVASSHSKHMQVHLIVTKDALVCKIYSIDCDERAISRCIALKLVFFGHSIRSFLRSFLFVLMVIIFDVDTFDNESVNMDQNQANAHNKN